MAAISKSTEVIDEKLVPLTVEITDIPLELSRGSVIDIYGINKRDTKSITTPVLMANNVSVSQVLERSNSGIASVLVILKNDQVQIPN